MRKWYASIINSIVFDNFDKFMKGKPDYTQEELFKKVPKEYHSMINIFMKRGTDMLLEYQDKNHSIQLDIIAAFNQIRIKESQE